MSDLSVWAVVPAAGIGSRMQADKPKQYLDLQGKPIIEHSLQRLASHPNIAGLIIATAADDRWWQDISLTTVLPVHVVAGGAERADSVLNALSCLATITDDDPWVLVHDAARPCVRHADIDRMLALLGSHPVGGILGVPVTDTVKYVDSQQQITATLARTGLWRALTPQMFRLRMLKQALSLAKQQQLTVTDEASAIELMGLAALMVEGHADNIKITVPEDLALAELLLNRQNGAFDES